MISGFIGAILSRIDRIKAGDDIRLYGQGLTYLK